MCIEVIVFIALALYFGLLLYFKVQGEKIIMKQIDSNDTIEVVQCEDVSITESESK